MLERFDIWEKDLEFLDSVIMKLRDDEDRRKRKVRLRRCRLADFANAHLFSRQRGRWLFHPLRPIPKHLISKVWQSNKCLVPRAIRCMPLPVPWQVSGIFGTIFSSYLFVASCARLCVREERGNVACYRPLCIVLPRCACLCKAKGRGPTAALKRLANNAWSGEAGICQAEAKRAWVDKARTASLLGSCPDSHKSFNSGTKAWAAFACEALQLKGKEFPPPLDGLFSLVGIISAS